MNSIQKQVKNKSNNYTDKLSDKKLSSTKLKPIITDEKIQRTKIQLKLMRQKSLQLLKDRQISLFPSINDWKSYQSTLYKIKSPITIQDLSIRHKQNQLQIPNTHKKSQTKTKSINKKKSNQQQKPAKPKKQQKIKEKKIKNDFKAQNHSFQPALSSPLRQQSPFPSTCKSPQSQSHALKTSPSSQYQTQYQSIPQFLSGHSQSNLKQKIVENGKELKNGHLKKKKQEKLNNKQAKYLQFAQISTESSLLAQSILVKPLISQKILQSSTQDSHFKKPSNLSIPDLNKKFHSQQYQHQLSFKKDDNAFQNEKDENNIYSSKLQSSQKIVQQKQLVNKKHIATPLKSQPRPINGLQLLQQQFNYKQPKLNNSFSNKEMLFQEEEEFNLSYFENKKNISNEQIKKQKTTKSSKNHDEFQDFIDSNQGFLQETQGQGPQKVINQNIDLSDQKILYPLKYKLDTSFVDLQDLNINHKKKVFSLNFDNLQENNGILSDDKIQKQPQLNGEYQKQTHIKPLPSSVNTKFPSLSSVTQKFSLKSESSSTSTFKYTLGDYNNISYLTTKVNQKTNEVNKIKGSENLIEKAQKQQNNKKQGFGMGKGSDQDNIKQTTENISAYFNSTQQLQPLKPTPLIHSNSAINQLYFPSDQYEPEPVSLSQSSYFPNNRSSYRNCSAKSSQVFYDIENNYLKNRQKRYKRYRMYMDQKEKIQLQSQINYTHDDIDTDQQTQKSQEIIGKVKLQRQVDLINESYDSYRNETPISNPNEQIEGGNSEDPNSIAHQSTSRNRLDIFARYSNIENPEKQTRKRILHALLKETIINMCTNPSLHSPFNLLYKQPGSFKFISVKDIMENSNLNQGMSGNYYAPSIVYKGQEGHDEDYSIRQDLDRRHLLNIATKTTKRKYIRKDSKKSESPKSLSSSDQLFRQLKQQQSSNSPSSGQNCSSPSQKRIKNKKQQQNDTPKVSRKRSRAHRSTSKEKSSSSQLFSPKPHPPRKYLNPSYQQLIKQPLLQLHDDSTRNKKSEEPRKKDPKKHKKIKQSKAQKKFQYFQKSSLKYQQSSTRSGPGPRNKFSLPQIQRQYQTAFHQMLLQYGDMFQQQVDLLDLRQKLAQKQKILKKQKSKCKQQEIYEEQAMNTSLAMSQREFGYEGLAGLDGLVEDQGGQVQGDYQFEFQ